MPVKGLKVCTPTSITYSGTSASINSDGSVSFTACTSLSLNGVFTSDYDNYMVVTHFDAASTTGLFMRLRSSGTDTTSGYTVQHYFANDASLQASRGTDTYIGGTYSYGGNGCGFTAHIFGPYLSQPTIQRPVGVADYLGASIYDYSGRHSGSTSFDGITFAPNAGSINLTGLVFVAGWVQ